MGESEQPCVQVLLADPDMECYKGDHIVVMIIGGLGLLVYTFGHGTAIARHLALWPRHLALVASDAARPVLLCIGH
jgi:hypothetical protein